jgi:hypothetical protein
MDVFADPARLFESSPLRLALDGLLFGGVQGSLELLESMRVQLTIVKDLLSIGCINL